MTSSTGVLNRSGCRPRASRLAHAILWPPAAALLALLPVIGCGGGGNGATTTGPDALTPGVWISHDAEDPLLYQIRDAEGNTTDLFGVRDPLGQPQEATSAIVRLATGESTTITLDGADLPRKCVLADGSSVRFDHNSDGNTRVRVVDSDGLFIADEIVSSGSTMSGVEVRHAQVNDERHIGTTGSGGSPNDRVRVRIRLLDCNGAASGALSQRALTAGVFVEDYDGIVQRAMHARAEGGELVVDVPRQWTTSELTISECQALSRTLDDLNKTCGAIGRVTELISRIPRASPQFIAIMASLNVVFDVWCGSVTLAKEECLESDRPQPSQVHITSRSVQARVHVPSCKGLVVLESGWRRVTSSNELVIDLDACAVGGGQGVVSGLVMLGVADGGNVYGGDGSYYITRESGVATLFKGPTAITDVDEFLLSSNTFGTLAKLSTFCRGQLSIRADPESGELHTLTELEHRLTVFQSPTPSQENAYQEWLASAYSKPFGPEINRGVHIKMQIFPLQRVRFQVSVQGSLNEQIDAWSGTVSRRLVLLPGTSGVLEISYDDVYSALVAELGVDPFGEVGLIPPCVEVTLTTGNVATSGAAFDGLKIYDELMTYKVDILDE